ncbi:putative pectinesterase/pectinesterase inhibitor 28, partial [Mucuna pruriens]
MFKKKVEKGKRIVIIGVSTLLLVAIAVAVILGVNISVTKKDLDDDIEENKKNHLHTKILVWMGLRIPLVKLSHKPNVTVAKNGNGDFKSLNEALKQVLKKNQNPFVVYIKEGIYQEYVKVKKEMTHVVFIGEGGKEHE